MKEKNKDFEIEELVFRTFLKYIKANNLYTAFRLSINHTRGDKDIFHIESPCCINNGQDR